MLKNKRIKVGAVLVVNEKYPDATLHGECVLVVEIRNNIYPISAIDSDGPTGWRLNKHLLEEDEVEYICDL